MSKLINVQSAVFQIDVLTVSPMLQIEPSDSSKRDSLIKAASPVITKKRKYIAESGKIVDVPFFSANGYRGILRRNITSAIFSNIEKKDGKKFGLGSIHLYASGGGTSTEGIKNLNYIEKIKLREDNPFLSCFGAGLSDIDGKLSVSDIVPVVKSGQIHHQYGVRFDESQRASILTPLIDMESIEKHNEEMKKKSDSNTKIKAYKKDLADKIAELDSKDEDIDSDEKKGLEEKIEALKASITAEEEKQEISYQQMYKAEFIVPNTQMSSCIGTRAGYELTPVEKGMILHGLIQTSQQSIGSYSRVGWGTNKWEVKDENGELLFKTTPNEKYILHKETEITDLGKAILKPFEEWLEKTTRDSIFLID